MLFSHILSVASASPVLYARFCDPITGTALTGSIYGIVQSANDLGLGIAETVGGLIAGPIGWLGALNGAATTALAGVGLGDTITSTTLSGIACLPVDTTADITSSSLSAAIDLSKNLEQLKSVDIKDPQIAPTVNTVYDNGKQIVQTLLNVAETALLQDSTLAEQFSDSMLTLKDLYARL